jgi:hypothetical protein
MMRYENPHVLNHRFYFTFHPPSFYLMDENKADIVSLASASKLLVDHEQLPIIPLLITKVRFIEVSMRCN